MYITNLGNVTKVAPMPIYGYNPSKVFFSGTDGLISSKLDMYDLGAKMKKKKFKIF